MGGNTPHINALGFYNMGSTFPPFPLEARERAKNSKSQIASVRVLVRREVMQEAIKEAGERLGLSFLAWPVPGSPKWQKVFSGFQEKVFSRPHSHFSKGRVGESFGTSRFASAQVTKQRKKKAKKARVGWHSTDGSGGLLSQEDGRRSTLPPTNMELQKGPFQEESRLSTGGLCTFMLAGGRVCRPKPDLHLHWKEGAGADGWAEPQRAALHPGCEPFGGPTGT